MQGRILAEIMVAGTINIYELQRRCRIGVENPDKNYDTTFRRVLFELLQERVLVMDFESRVAICQTHRNGTLV